MTSPHSWPRLRACAFLLALSACSAAETKPAAGGMEPGDGNDDVDGSTSPTEPDGGDGEVPLPPYDTSVIQVDSEGDVPCTLSANRRELLVRMTNTGTEASPALVLGVRTHDTDFRSDVNLPALLPGEGAELRIPRGPAAGFRPHWEFEVVVDPEATRGAVASVRAGVCDDDLRKRASDAMAVLRSWYDMETGLWNRSEWWRGANMLEVSMDYARETGDGSYFELIENTFLKNADGAKHPDGWDISHGNFLNEFYDDEGWWALAWIKAYDLTGQTKYLDMAKTIFAAMLEGWDDTCGGGLYWRTPHEAKNAIPNELFLTIAARLHLRTPGETTYLDWAKREWAWFKNTGMITGDDRIVDGLNTACQAGGAVYSYNQGVILGGLVELWRATGDASLLDEAETLAAAALANMTNADGVYLEEVCDDGNTCDANDDDDSDGCRCGDGDGVQFKGVFARNIALLNDVRPKEAYRQFLLVQSDSIWNHARSADNKLGKNWQGDYDEKGDASRQSSAMDALIGAVRAADFNVALGATTSGTPGCTANEGPARVVDGNDRGGSKWCAGGAGGQTLTVDLGQAREITGIRLRHAGAGGEDPAWNTRDFKLEVSDDGARYEVVADVRGNTENVTTHYLPARSVRQVRLTIDTAQTATDFVAARIYELEVLAVSR